ncbi:hypothetical protein ACFLXA_01540 [Chloroflexota bacterium]
MINFPANVIVNIPANLFLPGNCRVSGRVNSGSEVRALKDFYGGRLYNLEITDLDLDDQDLLESLKGSRVNVLVTRQDLAFIGRNVESIRETLPVFHVFPDEHLLKKVNFLTGLRFPVHIATDHPSTSPDTLLQALDFYLHSPLLNIPLEPFHTLLITQGKGKGLSLWDIEKERSSLNFYIHENNISLSRRWLDRKKYFGELDNTWTAIMNSDLIIELKSLKNTLFKNKAICIFCPHLDLCNGFLKAADIERPCDDWKAVFNIIKDEVNIAADLLRS